MSNQERLLCWLWSFVIVLVGCLAVPANAQIDENQFAADVKALTVGPTRSPGTQGYHDAAVYLQQQITPLRNVQLRQHLFPMMVPFTESATLAVPGEPLENIYPLWPAGVRLNSTPVDGITGRLVYCRDAELKDINPADLNGQIAVMETTSGPNWIVAVNMGAKAILLLGTPQTNNVDLRAHDFHIPVNFPRFFIPPGLLANAMRAGRISVPVTLKATVSWTKILAVNYYALVTPATPVGGGGAPPAALAITVPFDSSGLVPDLSPGASQAVQAACGLGLLRDFSRAPPDRPVLVCFTGGDSIAFLGSRNMHMALSDVPATWTGEIADFTAKETAARQQLHRAREIQQLPATINITADRVLIDRLAKTIETEAAFVQDQLFEVRGVTVGETTPQSLKQRQSLEVRQALLSRLEYAFKEQPRELASAELSDDARDMCDRVIETLNGSARKRTSGLIQDYTARLRELQDRVDLYHWLANAEGRNPDPEMGGGNSWLIELLVGLDLTDRGYRAGPIQFGQFAHSSTIADVQHYTEWFNRAEQGFLKNEPTFGWFKDVYGTIDLSPLSNALTPTSWMPGLQSIPSEMGQAWGVPSMSFITLDDLRLYRDTPADTLDKIPHFTSIVQQLNAIRILVTHAWADPKFSSSGHPKGNTVTLTGQVVSPSPGKPVPDLPRGGFLATYFNISRDDLKIPALRTEPYCIGNRRTEVQPCDADGNYRFEGMWRLQTDQEEMAINAFQIAPGTGVITATTDLGTQAGDVKIYANYRDRDPDPVRSLVFNCSEFSLAGLYDPRYLQDLNDVLMLDARRNAEPQKYNALIQQQLMAGFVEPTSKVYLLLRYGRVGNRLILVNMPKPTANDISSSAGADELGRGFTPGQLNKLGLLSLVTANDFWNIDDLRLKKYARAGVTSDLIDSLHKQASEQIAEANRLADSPRADGQSLVTNICDWLDL